MSANAVINVRTTPELKTDAAKIFSDLGMDMSTAINLFLTQVVRQRAIPFELTLTVDKRTDAKAAFETLMKYHGKIKRTIDYKAEKAAYLDEKYNSD